MKLIVVRHGEAGHNFGGDKLHTFAGGLVDTELTPKGIETAKKIAEQLKIKNIDIIFSSNLKRSKKTAEIIRDQILSGREIIVLPELNELNIGDFAGHTAEEVKFLFPKSAKYFYDGEIEKWSFPKGEDFFSALARVNLALEKIESLGQKKTVLIVAHGMINRIIFYLLDRKNIDNWRIREYPHDKIVELEVI